MAYIRKIISKDEELIGIARLHWIYVMKGLAWFIIMAGAGWVFNELMTRGMAVVGNAMGAYAIPIAFVTVSRGIMYFMMGGGFFVFFLFVLKVLVTEIGLSNRRVLHKTGLIFVKVQQVDIEEIRGENLDLGNLGRILGYGYLMLDCRFIGDVRLPAIEKPERFLRALHAVREKSQDALSLVVGKGKAVPVADAVPPSPSGERELQMQAPEPPKPAQPDINPGHQPVPEAEPHIEPGREAPMQPTPHSPPSPVQPPPAPEPPPAQPVQPIPAPVPSQPIIQPPNGDPVAKIVAIDPATVAQVVEQVTPQIAQQVVRQMADQGLLHNAGPAPANDVDTGLTSSFDEARSNPKSGHDPNNKMEYAVH